MLGRMKIRPGRLLTPLFLCGASLVQGAVESLPLTGAATGVDIGPEDGFLDWYDNHPGWVGDDRYTAYRTAAQFALIVPPGATINSASLTVSITNSGGIRQVEVNVIKGDGGIGFGAMLFKGQTERRTIDTAGTSILKLDVTGFISNLVSNGAAFVDFNAAEVPANTNYDRPMVLELAGGGAPELLVDYPSAGPPAGHYRYQLGTGSGPLLWDFGGALAGDFAQHANGKLTAFSGSGVVKGDGTGISVRFAYKEPAQVGESERFTFALVLDPATRTLSGTRVHRSVTVTCDTIIGPCHRHVEVDTSPVTIALPGGNDGRWSLDVALSRNLARLSGNAFLTFPNGDVFQFRVRGKYLEKSQKANLVLSGAGANTGASLLLSITVPDMTIESMRGKVAGQKIDWRL